MNPWNVYCARNTLHGTTGRDRAKYNLMNRLENQIPSILSYHNVDIDGQERNIVILNSDNLNQKTLCSMPGEDIRHGSEIDWNNYKWLVTERDANSEIYTKCIMEQCNYLLRWIDPDEKVVIERWCVIEDGTKYLTGEFGDKDMAMLRGDSRVSMTITKDEYTLKFGRNSRFIIDDYGSPEPLAYRMTKPYKLGGSFDENGVLRFVLTECNVEADDNIELHIPDYYTYFPRDEEAFNHAPALVEVDSSNEERRVWI